MVPSRPSPVGKTLGSLVQKPTLHRSISTKVLLAEGEDTAFTEHCRHYEGSYRVSGAKDLQAGKGPVPLFLSPKCSGRIFPGHLALMVNTALQEPQGLTRSLCTAPAGRDTEPEGPGTRVAPGPHQAPLTHQGRDHGRHPAQVPAGGRTDCLGVCGPGGDESSLSGGKPLCPGTEHHCSPACPLIHGLPADRKGVEEEDRRLVHQKTLVWQALDPGSLFPRTG